jgi:multiple sugar transport system substrate-binding protein
MRTFLIILVALLLASVVAWAIRPRPAPGKMPLVWVSDDNPARRDHIKQFNRLHPEFDLRLDPDNAGPEKTIVQSTGGVGPDLFDCYGPFQLASFVRAGIAWDVTDQLRTANINVGQECWPAIVPHVIYEGRTYGFPANTAVDVLFFNKDIFDRMGVPYPKGPMTWEEFIPLAQRMTVRDESGRVKQWGVYYDEWLWKYFIVQWGGRLYSEDLTRCTLNSPQCIAAMQMAQDLIHKYHVMPRPADETTFASAGGYGTSAMKYLGASRVAMAIGGRWWLTTLRNYQGLRLGAVESPHGPLRQFYSYGKSTIINAKSPRREEALKFLLYMSGPEYNRLINQQADGLGPVMKYCTDENMINPDFPNEDFQQVFRDAQARGVPEQTSPFINTGVVEGIVGRQFELIRLNAKSPADAMASAENELNDEIDKRLRRDPELKKRYDALIEKHARAH